MAFKLQRFFFGGYTANQSDIDLLKVKSINNLGLQISMSLNPNQGMGVIRGKTLKQGQNYSPVPVCVFRKDNRQLLWETKSKSDGSYSFRNIAVGLNCFVVAFDPNNQYNAVIQDNVVAVDGRIS